jgi:DNA-binding MarR family transcriptional regulator
MTDAIDQIATGFGRLAAFWRASRWQETAAHGLHPTQAEILQRVAARPERPADLARALGVTPASLSDSVSALVAKGLVGRRPDPADGRAHQVAPTAAGLALAARLPGAPAILRAQIAALPGHERAALLRTLTRLIRGLQQARAIPVQRMCATCTHFRPHAHDDPARPHHCAFVDAAFGDAALRLDCGDHDAAPAEAAAASWRRFEAA